MTMHNSRSYRARGCLALGFVLCAVSACDTSSGYSFSLPSVSKPFAGADEGNDTSIPKITPDSSIPILLLSNEQETGFTVNGKTLNTAKNLKVLVPNSDLEITAQAPCYRPLTQRARAGDFGPMSQFEFTFADWDKDPGSGGQGCG
jgi:hypothetical protein